MTCSVQDNHFIPVAPFFTPFSQISKWFRTICGCHINENHRIIECFGLEGTFRGHLAQPTCSEQGHLQLDQVAQSPVQPGLECFQGWGLHYLSGQPVPVFHQPHGKKFLSYVQFILTQVLVLTQGQQFSTLLTPGLIFTDNHRHIELTGDERVTSRILFFHLDPCPSSLQPTRPSATEGYLIRCLLQSCLRINE